MRALVRLLCLLICSAGLLPAQGLLIYCENDPPVQYVGPDGKLAGYTIELVCELQRRVGNHDPILMVPWARAYAAIQGQPNVVLFQMARTARRDTLFQWVGPISETSLGLYARADSPLAVASLEEAKAVGRIGVYQNDERDQFLTKAGFTNLERVADNLLNVKKLMAGRIDLYADASLTFGRHVLAAGFRPADVKNLLNFETVKVYIAMSRAMPPAVVASWNAALASMRRDGTFQKLYAQYFPGARPPGHP
jgi:polar amino acid transport system substrate-binding protein